MKILSTFFGNTFQDNFVDLFRAGNEETFCFGGLNRTIFALGGGPKCPLPGSASDRHRPEASDLL